MTVTVKMNLRKIAQKNTNAFNINKNIFDQHSQVCHSATKVETFSTAIKMK